MLTPALASSVSNVLAVIQAMIIQLEEECYLLNNNNKGDYLKDTSLMLNCQFVYLKNKNQSQSQFVCGLNIQL